MTPPPYEDAVEGAPNFRRRGPEANERREISRQFKLLMNLVNICECPPNSHTRPSAEEPDIQCEFIHLAGCTEVTRAEASAAITTESTTWPARPIADAALTMTYSTLISVIVADNRT